MKDRVKEIRNDFKMSQTAFAESLGITRDGVAGYESGRTNLSKTMIKLICHEFKVNENWLINGIGEKYINIQSTDSVVESLAKEHNWDSTDKELAMMYVNNPGIRDKLKALLDEYEASKKD